MTALNVDPERVQHVLKKPAGAKVAKGAEVSETDLPYCNNQTIRYQRVAEIGQLVKDGFEKFSQTHEPEAIRKLYGGNHRMQWFADGYSSWSLVYRVEDALYRLVTATLVPPVEGRPKIHWRVFSENYQRAGIDESDIGALRNEIIRTYRTPEQRPYDELVVEDPSEDSYRVSMGESQQQIIARFAEDADDDE